MLLTADPALAMELAQRLMVKPLMANHHHGLWGYSGRTEAGHELTVQAGGIGAPSTAAVASELAGHGARRIVRIGTCAALDASLSAGEPILVRSALGADGTSAALGADVTQPDAGLTELLGGVAADIASFDLGAEAPVAMREEWSEAGIAAIDMETAAVFAVAERPGVAAAALVVVAETAAGEQAEEGSVREGLLELGAQGAIALAAPGPADERRSEHAIRA